LLLVWTAVDSGSTDTILIQVALKPSISSLPGELLPLLAHGTEVVALDALIDLAQLRLKLLHLIITSTGSNGEFKFEFKFERQHYPFAEFSRIIASSSA
jgi:hypothetical protein